MNDQGLSSGGVSQALIELARIAVSDEDLASATRHITDTAVEVFDAADFAGLSLVENGDIGTSGATHRIARQLDEIQHETNNGPCISAIREQTDMEIPDVPHDETWPDYSKMIGELGIGSVHAFVMQIGPEVVGAINFYSVRPRTMSADQRAAAVLLAAQSAMVLRIMQIRRNGEARRVELEAGLETRDLVGKAIGIMMQREGFTSDRAFIELRSLSQNENRRLRDVAQGIVVEANARAAEAKLAEPPP